jgi:acetylornithine/succinyldiaminopimelate/putrescine aminotransferase
VGLLIAVEFENSEINFEIIKECVNAGIITDWFLFNDRCMRIAPPLIIQESDIIASCEIINQCIKKVLG